MPRPPGYERFQAKTVTFRLSGNWRQPRDLRPRAALSQVYPVNHVFQFLGYSSGYNSCRLALAFASRDGDRLLNDAKFRTRIAPFSEKYFADEISKNSR